MQTPLARVVVETPSIVTPQSQVTSQVPSVATQVTYATQKNSTILRILKLGTIYSMLFATPVAAAYGLTQAGTLKFNQGLTSPLASADAPNRISQAQAPFSAETPVQTAQVESTATPAPQNYEYEVSLANGFLKKAIEFSNSTTAQTVEDKDMIVLLLNQALEAANRAVSINPNDPAGYMSRGRIYQVTSVVKPEMKQLADQDFAKASSLGAPNPTQAPATKNPMDLLPTEQAASKSTAMIAGPEDGKTKETVQGEAEKNAKRGSVTLEAGKSEVFVPYMQVKDTTQLYVTAEKNPENLPIYVKNKQAGVGFTVATTSAPNSPLDITWWEIE